MDFRKFAIRLGQPLSVPLLYLSLIALLWAGFGLGRVGLYEEWTILSTIDSSVPVLINLESNHITGFGLEVFYTRPLSLAPNNLGFMLTPNSFVGQHILLILFLFGCGYFGYRLVNLLLPSRREVALLTGMLCMFPIADSGYLNFRLLVVVFVTLCWIMSAWLLVVYFQYKRLPVLILMYIVLCAGLLGYESPYPIVLCTPIVLVWLARGVTRRVILCSILWYIGPLVTLIRTALVTSNGDASYIANLASINAALGFKTIVLNALAATRRAYQRSFIDAWLEGLSKLGESPYMGYALLMTVIGTAAIIRLVWFNRPSPEFQAPRIGFRRWLFMLVISLGAVIAGFAIFLPLQAYRNINDRVFMMTGFGTALSVSLLLYLFTQWVGRYYSNARLGRTLFTLGASAMILATSAQVVDQHRVYNELSLVLQRFLGQMMQLAPGFTPGTQVMVVDETGSLYGDQFLGEEGFISSLIRVMYHDNRINAFICYPYVHYGAPMGTCQVKADKFTNLGTSRIQDFMNSYHDNSELVIFKYSPDRNLTLMQKIPDEILEGKTSLYYFPLDRIVDAPPTLRQRELLACWPIEPCTDSITPKPVTTFFTGFSPQDELLRHGLGWFKPSPPADERKLTLTWNSSYRSTIYTLLAPAKAPYLLSLRILYSGLDNLPRDLWLRVNGVPVGLNWTQETAGPARGEAVIPLDVILLNPAYTQLEFSFAKLIYITPPNTSIMGSVAFDYISIKPQ